MEIDNIHLNPIDIVEDVIYEKKWSFSRADDYELEADISSKWCQYRLYFTWSENVRAMSFTITFDLKFPQSKLALDDKEVVKDGFVHSYDYGYADEVAKLEKEKGSLEQSGDLKSKLRIRQIDRLVDNLAMQQGLTSENE